MKRYETLTLTAKEKISQVIAYTFKYDCSEALDCDGMSCSECPYGREEADCFDENGCHIKRSCDEWIAWVMEEI